MTEGKCGADLDAAAPAASVADTRVTKEAQVGIAKAFAIIAALCFVLGFTASSAEAQNLVQFKTNLDDALKGNVVGYAFAISKQGDIKNAGAGGMARRPNDGNKNMTTRTRQNIASVTKTITTIAVMQLLEKNNLTITHRIAPFLPKGWRRGNGFARSSSLTFQNLLTHKSGLDQRFQSLSKTGQGKWGNDWDGLKYIVALGVRPQDVGKRAYKNANFALFRVIIPILWMRSKGASWDHVNANSSGFMYGAYVYEHIFQPLNIRPTSCEENRPNSHAAGYNISSPGSSGALWNVAFRSCGGHGNWHLSARELAKIATHMNCANHAHFPKAKRLLSKAACFAMDLRRLGWAANSNGSKQRWKGKYWHGGDLFSPKTKPRKALHACMMKFPGGVEAALVINSDTKNGRSACTILLDAYEQS